MRYNIVCHHSDTQNILKILKENDRDLKASRSYEIDDMHRFTIQVETYLSSDSVKIHFNNKYKYRDRMVEITNGEIDAPPLNEVNHNGDIYAKIDN